MDPEVASEAIAPVSAFVDARELIRERKPVST
jgi:hypothetical protein